MTNETDVPAGSIAIVGIAGRFPEADDVQTYWSNLGSGRESITRFTPEQLRAAGVPEEMIADPDYVAAAGILSDVAGFDTDLFQMSASDAALTDPQQRLFLEAVWTALDDAAVNTPDRKRRTAIYASTDFNTYLPFVIGSRLSSLGPVQAFQVEMGNANDFLATRVSYKLDLRGPSLTVQTACSSSLVAVHTACEALLAGACDTAVAGGSRIHVPQEEGHLHHAGGVAAAEPHCKPFDQGATGTLRGNGVGVVVLKRAEEAVRDGDHIYALILGTAVNNDGGDKVGFTAPSVGGQAAVIGEALELAGVTPGQVSYVETHGTGTALGDPIEFEALAEALDGRSPGGPPCVLGAVKPNIGHLGSTAGIAGLIKVALAIEHETIPGTLHFQTPNAAIPLAETRFSITQEPTRWPRRADRPRIAGVSSFGIGGTNCHVVLGEPPVRPRPTVQPEAELLLLSAVSAAALDESVDRLAAKLTSDAPSLADTAHSLQVGRRMLSHRWAGVASSTGEAVERLRTRTMRHSEATADPIFMFPGQGSEYAGMAGYLRGRYPTFRNDIEYCADMLAASHDIDLLAFLETGETPPGVARTAVVQPALYAVECGLGRLWRSWGIEPAALIGHSIGEYAAAALSGVFSFEDGLALTAARGAAMAEIRAGVMLAVRASEQTVRELLTEDVSICAVNAPRATVVGGDVDAVKAFRSRIEAESIPSTWLRVDHAFHSPSVRGHVSRLREAFAGVALSAPQTPLYSNVTGALLRADQAESPDYWAAQMTEAVRFMDCVRAAAADGDNFFVEMGPGDVLRSFARQSMPDLPTGRLAVTLGRGAELERESVLEGLGALWQAGGSVDWEAAELSQGRKISLPGYPMQRRRCWFGDNRQEGGTAEKVVATKAPATPKPDPNELNVREAVLAQIADVMGVHSTMVHPAVPLVEQGMDSLTLLETAERVRKEFAVKLSLADMLSGAATVEGVVRHILAASPAAALAVPSVAAPAVEPEQATIPEAAGAIIPPVYQTALAAEQQDFISDFVPKFVARTARSQSYNQQYRRVHADPRNSSGFRSAWKEMVYPIVTERASGAYVWDLDGNQYIDMTMGFGSVLFGHAPDFVSDAMRSELDAGFTVGPQAALSGVVAQQVCDLTGFDRVAFTNSGTEAVMTAIRLARAVTRRDRIVVFRGSYHGTYDGVLARAQRADNPQALPTALGVPRSLVSDVIVLEYGTPEALSFIAREGNTIAAVLAEPVQSRRPGYLPEEFLHDLRSITRAHGTLLLLDEIITGFRAHPGGVNALWNLGADLVTYGKVLGGGMPIGAVAGRSHILDLIDGGEWSYGDSSRPESELTFFAGTFCKHPLAMVAANAVLAEMSRRGEELQRDLTSRATELAARTQAICAEAGLPITVENYASQLYLNTSGIGDIGELLIKGLVHRGVYIWEGRTSFLSTAHDDDDLDEVVAAMGEVTRELVDRRVLRRTEGRASTPGVAPESSPTVIRDEQELLWLGAEMTPEAWAAYNEIVTMPVAGALDPDLVAQAVAGLVDRHDALRLRMDTMARTQATVEDSSIAVEVVDIGDGDERWVRGRHHVLEMLRTRFDLHAGPLLRAALLRSARNESVVVLVAPHAVVDGWSVGVLRRDFEEIFTALCAGDPPNLPTADSFLDFVHWESDRMVEERADTSAYWKKQLYGVDSTSFFKPGARESRNYEAAVRRKDLGGDMRNVLRRRSRESSATPYVLGLASWCAALAIATGREDVVVASAYTGQTMNAEAGLVGYCLKILPQRVTMTDIQRVSELVERAGQAVRGAVDNWFISQAALIERFWPAQDGNRPPMGGVFFDLEIRDKPAALPGTTALDVDLAEVTYTKWDAGLVLVDTGESLIAEVVFNPAIVTERQADGLLDICVQVLRRVCEGPDLPWRSPNVTVAGISADRRRSLVAPTDRS